MSETNVVVFSGTVRTDVDYRVIPGAQKPIAEFSIVNNRYKPNSQVESGFDQHSTWVSVRLNGRVADSASKNIQKSMKITVTGELSEDVWPNQNNPGTNHRRLYVVGHSFENHKWAGDK